MTEHSTSLATLANIHDIVEGRDRAIARWMTIYETYHRESELAALDCIGGSLSLIFERGYNTDSADHEFTRAFLRKGGQSENEFRAALTKLVDQRCWAQMLDNLGFEQLLDAKAKKEWRDSLYSDPPAFTAENCEATFANMWENRNFFYNRGVAELFSKLDRRFRSHNGFRFGNRVIIDGAIEKGFSYWSRYEKRDVINDIERTLHELDGQPAPRSSDFTRAEKAKFTDRGLEPPEWYRPLTELIEERYRDQMVPSEIDGEYLAARLFKNGNVHIWFRNKALHHKLNMILASYYGEVIGDGYETTEADAQPSNHLTPAKNFGEFFTSDDVAQVVVNRYADLGPKDYVLEPSAGKGALASKAVALGAKVDCIEIQPGHAHELAISGLYNNVRCADFLQIEPPLDPSRLYDAIIMNPPFDRGRDCMHVMHAWKFLKPGGKLVAIMAARAEFGDDARHKALHKLIQPCKNIYGWDGNKWIDLPERSFAHADME